MRKGLNKVYNKWCRRKLRATLPGILAELKDYSKGSDTTGTQWATLWHSVDGILTHRPDHILECGTGSSTIVLAAAVLKLKQSVPGYDGKITSMESVEAWYDIAKANLPDKYREIVTILHGEREKYEIGMFRGYSHSNIPKRDYGFILLDGPNFEDDQGMTFCSDAFRALELSSHETVQGVIDGRTSSAYVMQMLLGTKAVKAFPSLYYSTFSISKSDLKIPENSSDLTTRFGRVVFKR